MEETDTNIITGMKTWKPTIFQFVAIAALVIIILRMVFPKIVFDNTSLILFGMAAFIFLLPKLLAIFPPLKKLKIWEVEAEFNKAINQLEASVGKAEKEPTAQPPKKLGIYPPMQDEYISGFKDILSARTSTTEKIVAAGILCEQMLTKTARDLELFKDKQVKTPRAIVQELAKHEFISEAERQAFDEFWTIRNSVVHGQAPPPSEEQTARLLDLLWRLVRTLA